MPIKHLVEIGRIAYVGYGRNAGKPVAIVDVIDQNRALVDGPCSNVTRQPIRFKRLRLTKFKLNFSHGASSKVVKKEWEKEDITQQWKDSFQFKNLVADRRRKDLSDLGRFKVYKLKQKVNTMVKAKMAQIKSKEARAKKAERDQKAGKPVKQVKPRKPKAVKAKK